MVHIMTVCVILYRMGQKVNTIFFTRMLFITLNMQENSDLMTF